MRILEFLVMATLLVPACAGDADRYDRALVSDEIAVRTGYGLGPPREPGEAALPEGVRVEDGISEEEAIATALWNNAPFQETLAELGVARADLIQAGLLSNPTFSLLFPLGPKQLEFAAYLPLEAFVLRPGRVHAADLDARRIAVRLVENGLELIERVRLSYADLRFARDARAIAEDVARLRDEIAGFQRTRLENGDVSELEADLARVDAMKSRQDTMRLERDDLLARERLTDLLGLDETWLRLEFELAARGRRPESTAADESVERLIELALAARPDLRAAELGIEAAGERAGLSRWEFLSIAAGIDLNEDPNQPDDEGPEVGPAIQGELPLFDWNQGGAARADAELERAALRYVTVRRRIVLEVKEAHARFEQVAGELRAWRQEILPGLEAALERAEGVYATGSTSLLPVLEARERLLDARARAARLVADLDRSRASLERSVGRRLDVESPVTLGARTEGSP